MTTTEEHKKSSMKKYTFRGKGLEELLSLTKVLITFKKYNKNKNIN